MSDALTSSERNTSVDSVRQTARTWNFDFYLAATLAPQSAQDNLMALAAFVGELERIRLTVREPALAQIRIQWWRDELRRMSETDASDHPIGTAVLSALRTHDLPIGLLLGLADAFADQLSEPVLSDAQKLKAWLGKRFGGAFALAGRCLDAPLDADVASNATEAYGLARLISEQQGNENTLAALGIALSSSELHTQASAAIAVLRHAMRHASATTRSALLPASIARLYVNASKGPPTPLAKVCRVASAHWLGRF